MHIVPHSIYIIIISYLSSKYFIQMFMLNDSHQNLYIFVTKTGASMYTSIIRKELFEKKVST